MSWNLKRSFQQTIFTSDIPPSYLCITTWSSDFELHLRGQVGQCVVEISSFSDICIAAQDTHAYMHGDELSLFSNLSSILN